MPGNLELEDVLESSSRPLKYLLVPGCPAWSLSVQITEDNVSDAGHLGVRQSRRTCVQL